jgi:hypothetical protein
MAQADPNAGGQQPASYQELYASMPDVLDGVYTTYLAPFGPESGEQPATLRDRVISAANDVPKVFVMLLADPTPRIVFVHRPTRFASSLLGAQPWDDRVFGFQGDIRQGNQINLVEWPATPFARSILVTVPVLHQMDAAWTAAAGADALGPFLANDPETEQLRARFLCPVPQRYVSLCVNRSYTPGSFWTDVIGQIRQDQATQDCHVLVNWARVASTYGLVNAADDPTVPLATAGGLRVPLADDQLAARRWSWVLADLPALGRTGSTLERQFLQQNAVLSGLLQRQVDDAAAARQAAVAPKEFSSVYPQAAAEIQMLCEAATEDALPPIWRVLANVKKKEAVVAVSQLLNSRAREADSFRVAPVVTPELLERIWAFKAGTEDVDDITAGFSLFLLITGSPEATTQARDRAVVYGLLQGGHVAPSLDQLRDIIAGAPQMARTLIALERTYQGYSTLLEVLLGRHHRVSLHFHDFVTSFQILKMEVEEQFGADIHAALPLFQRHTQLTMARYFNDATVMGTQAALPRIMDLIDIIKYRQWTQLPQIPPRYTSATGPGGLARGTTSQPGGRSVPGTAPARSRPPGAAEGSDPPQQRVLNLAPNSVLMTRFASTDKRLRDLTPHGVVTPRGDNGTEVLCLSHILRGECNSNCTRRAAHRALTQTEVSRIAEFLTQAGVE